MTISETLLDMTRHGKLKWSRTTEQRFVTTHQGVTYKIDPNAVMIALNGGGEELDRFYPPEADEIYHLAEAAWLQERSLR